MEEPQSRPPGLTIVERAADDAAQPANAPSRQMPRIYEWIDLPEEQAGVGARIEMWVNFPPSFGERLEEAEEQEERFRLLRMVIRDHDLVDFDGEPLPPAGTDAFIKALPMTLWPTIFTAAQTQAMSLPKAIPTPSNGSS